MILRSIDFIQSENTPLEWRLEGLTLRQINLIVGKNATGKSKALAAIRDLARLVAGDIKPNRRSLRDVSYQASLVGPEGSAETDYSLKVAGNLVVEEKLAIDGAIKFDRGPGGVGKIWFDKQAQFLDFQSPEDELACASRRDTIQHAYLEKLYGWGKALACFKFDSRELGKQTLVSIVSTEIRTVDADAGYEDMGPHVSKWPVQVIYKLGIDLFSEIFMRSVLEDMRGLGYLLAEVGIRVVEPQGIAASTDKNDRDSICLYVIENGVGGPIDQSAMSDGMFRALSIVIRVAFAAMSEKSKCVLIDDIGEGLDYERSCLLIKLLIEKAQKAGIQLIMTTNDRFIMNNVPLEYWTVLVRECAARGTQIKVYNYETHKQVFDEFAYTGLNNFDFFATRFFEEGLGD